MGWILAAGDTGYPLGVEPMFPALGVSVLVWAADRFNAETGRHRRVDSTQSRRGAETSQLDTDLHGFAGSTRIGPSAHSSILVFLIVNR